MQTFFLIPLVLVSLLFAAGSERVDLEKEKAALLERHRLDRDAHFKRDAEALISASAAETYYVRDGRVMTRTKEESLKRVREYFASAEFSEWDDMMPPVIRVSPDGQMAWMIVRLKGKYTHTDKDGKKSVEEFICAWMSTYEKRGSNWIHIANVSTFDPSLN